MNENIFKTESGFYDSKHILNVSSVVVTEDILNKIEAGITSEQLNELKKTLPIFSYKTQITIHGLFPELKKNYQFGYKFIFQNKNKSIGIKYGAIDESKRKYLEPYLNYLGLHYRKDSSSQVFNRITSITKENYESKYNEFKALKEKIDKCNDLYNGNCTVFISRTLIGNFLCLEWCINTIPEDNITKLLAILEIDTEKVEAEIKAEAEAKAIKDAEWEAKYKKMQEDRIKVNNEAVRNLKSAGYTDYEKEFTEAIYFSFSANYEGNGLDICLYKITEKNKRLIYVQEKKIGLPEMNLTVLKSVQFPDIDKYERAKDKLAFTKYHKKLLKLK